MDKRAIIAFILIGVILFFYGDYVKWVSPPQPIVSDTTLTVDSIQVKRQIGGLGEPGALDTAATGLAGMVTASVGTDSVPAVIPDRLVTVETDRYRMVIDSRGAQITSLKLKPYGRYLREEVELIPARDGERPGYRFWTNDGLVQSSKQRYLVTGKGDAGDVSIKLTGLEKDTLVFASPLGAGRELRIKYTFTGDQFVFFVAAEGVGGETLWVRDYAEVVWSEGLAYTETDSAQDLAFSKAFTLYAGDILEEQDLDAKKSVLTNPTSGQVRWGAVRSKYFIAALLPETSSGVGGWMESKHDSTAVRKVQPNRLGVGVRIALQGSSPVTPVRVFVGPLDTKILESIDPTLKKTISWGYSLFAPFSKGILWGLKALYEIVPNYGWCIIIFSILIKVLLWPLTYKAYAATAAMQRVQPKLVTLREKYKDDPQRLNKEMMKLYKEEKVNPMGGCLPMLLQLPLLFALFTVFRSTIEFRQAPFALWITDLSLPDFIFQLPFAIPFYGDHFAVLPLLMAVSTYYQSKLTMTDPNQKMMLYMMPVMMLVMFNSFPSGLNLYYTLFNVWTVVQQKITPLPKGPQAETATA